MAEELIISVSGLRGVVGKSLTASVAYAFARAYGSTRARERVVVGRDSRPHGELLYHAAISGLLEAGCEPLLAGCVATPTCGVLVQAMGAAGGLVVTASHNPPEWNGIKLFQPTGRVLSGAEGAEIARLFRQAEFSPIEWNQVRRTQRIEDPLEEHLNRVLSLVDRDAIRRRCFRVVLDANHGAGGPLARRLLEELGCEVIGIGLEPTGLFRHPPEPIPAHLADVAPRVREARADIGFAQDPDADRLVLIDENGRLLSEELTLAVVADHFFARQPGPFVINLSTSRVSEEVARRRGATVHRAPVGEANVVDRALEVGATLAGEGNGGVIHRDVVWVRDSFTGMALVLDALAAASKTLSEYVASFPRWHMVKTKVPAQEERLERVQEALPGEFPEAAVDRSDGIRLETTDWWVHVRGSNTEPVARVIAEARELAQAEALVRTVRELLQA